MQAVGREWEYGSQCSFERETVGEGQNSNSCGSGTQENIHMGKVGKRKKAIKFNI
jgi:hypothetical protein